MIAIFKIKRILLGLLISVLFILVASQTVCAGSIEDNDKNSIIVSADGIAKVVDSTGKISLLSADGSIKKGEIKFGVNVTDILTIQVNNVDRNQSHHRGGKVCGTETLNTDFRIFYLYDYEFIHKYCLGESD